MLSEANLFDTVYLDKAIQELLSQKAVTEPEIRHWFQTQFVRWYKSPQNDDQKSLRIRSPRTDDPSWAQNKTFHEFVGFTPEETDRLRHLVDYFRSLDPQERLKIFKEPYSVILKKVSDWNARLGRRMNSQAVKILEKDVKTVLSFENGYRWVVLISPEAYREEGELMGHCVGGYHGAPGIQIYSLRDPKGNPHVTVSTEEAHTPPLHRVVDGKLVRRQGVSEIKGKANEPPVLKYRPYIFRLLDHLDMPVWGDGPAVGWDKYWQGRYYSPDSEQWKKDVLIPRDSIFRKIESRIHKGAYPESIDLSAFYIEELPEFFRGITVRGSVRLPSGLTSLKNCPGVVRGNFALRGTTLSNPTFEGAPRLVEGNLWMEMGNLVSCQGMPRVLRSIHLSHHKLTHLKGMQKHIYGSLDINQNPLTTFEGGPEEIDGSLVYSFVGGRPEEHVDPFPVVHESITFQPLHSRSDQVVVA